MSQDLEAIASGQIDRALKGKGFAYSEFRAGAPVYRGAVKSGSLSVPISMAIVDPLFTRAPLVRIEDSAIVERIEAHLNVDGDLCYIDRGLEEYDPYDAGGAALRCLESVRETLNLVLHSSTTADLEREFTSYWKATAYLYSDLPAGFSGKAIVCTWERPSRSLIVTTQDRAARWGDRRPASSLKSAYVLQAERPLISRRAHRPGTNLADFRAWCSQFVPVAELACALGPEVVDRHTIVVSAPNGAIAVDFEWPPVAKKAFAKAPADRRGRWVQANESQLGMKRMDVEAIDWPELVNARLPENSPFIGKSIAVVGCGAIGGRLVLDLVRMGAGIGALPLLMVDPDTYRHVNVGRHVLGVEAIHSPKAEALAAEARRLHPAVKVEPVVSDVFSCTPRLSRYDLVIDATGANPVALRLNEIAVSARRASRRFPAVLHASVHGNGLAVQTILVTDLHHACFKCMRPGHGEFKANPIKAGIETDAVPAACGDGAFVPYAAAAPALAGALAIQASAEWAREPTAPGPRVRTRVLDTEKTMPAKDKSWGVDASCPACQRTSDV